MERSDVSVNARDMAACLLFNGRTTPVWRVVPFATLIG
jgi:hypothetical protein